MGKISEALEKHKKEGYSSREAGRIKSELIKILSKIDAGSKKLNLKDPDIKIDKEAIKQLIKYRLINIDGTLTPAGLKLYPPKTPNKRKTVSAERKSVNSSNTNDSIAKNDNSRFAGTQDAHKNIANSYFRNGGLEVNDENTGKKTDFSRKAGKNNINELNKNKGKIQSLQKSGEINSEGKIPHQGFEHVKHNELRVNTKINKNNNLKHEKNTGSQSGVETNRDSVENSYSEKESIKEIKSKIPTIPAEKAEKRLKTVLRTNSRVKPKYDVISNQEALAETIKSSKEQSLLIDGNTYEKKTENTYNSTKKYDINLINRNLITHLKPKSVEAEQFKILRTNLFYSRENRSPRSLLVTSAMPREGKSFISSNLAISVASDIDKHVLLIDCDLRNPSIHKMFGYSEVYGLSDYLEKQVPLNLILLKTFSEKLTILPAGPPPENPAELVSSNLMTMLLKEVSERYPDRLIIIDTPPVRLAAETSALASVVSGILLVIKYGSTQRKFVGESIENFGRNKIIGSILNSFTIKNKIYNKQYYGKYYKTYIDNT